jgi:hypothetical protein
VEPAKARRKNDRKNSGGSPEKPGLNTPLDRECMMKPSGIAECKNASVSDSDAVFLGWQETITGKAIGLYNIIVKNHPSFGSTVTDRILRDLKLHVPKRQRKKDKGCV